MRRETILLDDLPSINVTSLLRIGALDGGEKLFPRIPHEFDFLGRLRCFQFRVDMALRGSQVFQMFQVQWTRCNFGGRRPWFICKHCGKRVGKLYVGLAIACRHCFNGAYPSQHLGKNARAHRRACEIRFSLGGEPSIRGDFPERPPRMWRRTYGRLRFEAERLEAQLRGTRFYRRPPDYKKFIPQTL